MLSDLNEVKIEPRQPRDIQQAYLPMAASQVITNVNLKWPFFSEIYPVVNLNMQNYLSVVTKLGLAKLPICECLWIKNKHMINILTFIP